MHGSRFSIVLGTLVATLFASAAVGQGFTPQEALTRMKVPEGFEVKLVASEPEIRQPVTMTFDDRGRLWVIQYLQYPTPNGLKPVQVDQFLRTTYDRMPEPPPHGPKGADRITILEDPDENGHYRKAKDFVSGLNLATGLALGNGGAYVVQPPYLLFYADKNGDDVPDGDPEVLLTGFGMEDAHAFANSLQFGPDGWLYGTQGSTVTAKILGIEFQQGIWRYHPTTRAFELFSEGGGNTWGLDFDRHGNVIAGTNWGGFAMLHQVQGGYYIKGFGKHGPLHNPYTFGYFDHVPYQKFKGGHVTCGGIVYQGGAYPEAYNNQYLAGNLLSNELYWHILERKGSSFTARLGGDFLVANDTWFRPIDCLIGPDGAVYVADWYDKRANHVDPVDNWDRSNGRIYKVVYKGGAKADPLNLAKRTSTELLPLLKHRNCWYSREARRILAERRDPAIIPELRKQAFEQKDASALEALWALYVSGGFDESTAGRLLDHTNEDVRTWAVRLLGDAKSITSATQDHFLRLARTEPSSTVRSQLACTCKRLPAKQSLPIVQEMLQREEDLADPHIPMLLWWAIEDKAATDRDQVLRMWEAPPAWQSAMVQRFMIERLGRRYMAEGTSEGLEACRRLLALAPTNADTLHLVDGMEKALEGRRLTQVPPVLEKSLADLWSRHRTELGVVRLALRLGSEPAFEQALQIATDAKVPESARAGLIEVLGQSSKKECVPILLKVFREAKSDSLRSATLSALQSYADPQIAEMLLTTYPKLSGSLRTKVQGLLSSRSTTALQLVEAVDQGKITPKEIAVDQLRQIALHNNEAINRLLEKHWGKVGASTTGARQARVRSVQHMLNLGKGDPGAGKVLFQKNCANCHMLFGEGSKVGPDLTSAERKNTGLLVTNVVDPSSVIRPEFIAQNVEMNDGRLLMGLIVESTPKSVTLLDAKNERTVLARDKIEQLKPSHLSLMPDNILDPLDDQQIRDLFSYLQSDVATNRSEKQASPSAPAAKAPLKVCLVSGALEYESDRSLSAFQKYLEENFNVKCSRAFRKSDDDLPGLENLDTCDVMLLFTRRLTISGEQLERVQKYCRSGKPIVGVRTASHAFQKWLELDKEILGGNYQGHFGQNLVCEVKIVDKAREHPILAGVTSFQSHGGLYKNTGLVPDVELLLTGTIPDHTEPIAWTRNYKGGRIFYTSLGSQKDFENENFKRMLTNALFWTTQRSPEKK